jgi:hypothetical protein
MLIVCSVVVRVVVTCVLAEWVVANDNALYLLHVFYFDHLDATLVNYLLQTWFVCTCVKLVLGLRKEIKNLTSVLLTFLKTLSWMVRAYQNDAEVRVFEAYVNVKHEVFGTTRNTNGRPRFTLFHWWHRPQIVKKKVHIFKNMKHSISYPPLLPGRTRQWICWSHSMLLLSSQIYLNHNEFETYASLSGLFGVNTARSNTFLAFWGNLSG